MGVLFFPYREKNKPMKQKITLTALSILAVPTLFLSDHPVESHLSTRSADSPLLVVDVAAREAAALDTAYASLAPLLEASAAPDIAPPLTPQAPVLPPPVLAYEPPPGSLSDRQLANLRMCESTNRYDINTGNGFYGAVQWIRPTWNAAAERAGMPEWIGVRPDLAPAEIQDHFTRIWWATSNPYTQWPVCSRRVGPY